MNWICQRTDGNSWAIPTLPMMLSNDPSVDKSTGTMTVTFLGEEGLSSGGLCCKMEDQAFKVVLNGSSSFAITGTDKTLRIEVKSKGRITQRHGLIILPITRLMRCLHYTTPQSSVDDAFSARQQCRTLLQEVDKANCLSIGTRELLNRILSNAMMDADGESLHEGWFDVGNDGKVEGRVRLRFEFREGDGRIEVAEDSNVYNVEESTAGKAKSRIRKLSTKAKAMMGGVVKGAVGNSSDKLGRPSKKGCSQDPAPIPMYDLAAEQGNCRYFGALLEDAVANSEGDIPDPVRVCVEFLEEHALEEEGLFRVAGNQDEVIWYVKEFEEGKSPPFETDNPHVCSGVLKKYFRKMAHPVVPYFLYPGLIAIADTNSLKDIEVLGSLFQSIPLANQRLLRYLLVFLKKVADLSEVNLMAPQNLAIVFAPNLLRPEVDDPTTMMRDSKLVNDIVRVLIENADAIVPEVPATAEAPSQAQSEQSDDPPAPPVPKKMPPPRKNSNLRSPPARVLASKNLPLPPIPNASASSTSGSTKPQGYSEPQGSLRSTAGVKKTVKLGARGPSHSPPSDKKPVPDLPEKRTPPFIPGRAAAMVDKFNGKPKPAIRSGRTITKPIQPGRAESIARKFGGSVKKNKEYGS